MTFQLKDHFSSTGNLTAANILKIQYASPSNLLCTLHNDRSRVQGRMMGVLRANSVHKHFFAKRASTPGPKSVGGEVFMCYVELSLFNIAISMFIRIRPSKSIR